MLTHFTVDSQANSKRVLRRSRVLKRNICRARVSQSPVSTDDEAEGADIGETGDTVTSRTQCHGRSLTVY